ncbi:hypothetical protein HMPREF3038_00746 [Akkermansia sp. KLE1797]|nr:hypothetical protein HMPREF3038_00746 [Akkermansia sp. KLE1797]
MTYGAFPPAVLGFACRERDKQNASVERNVPGKRLAGIPSLPGA